MSSPFSRVSSIMRLNRCVRGILLSRVRISFGTAEQIRIVLSPPPFCPRYYDTKEIAVIGLVFSRRRWISCLSGHDLRQVCITMQSAETYRVKVASYPRNPENGETLPSALEVCNFLRKRCSAVIHHCYGEYWDIYRRRGPPGLKANGVDRGLYPPST